MNKLRKTLIDLSILKRENINFVVTRFWRDSKVEPDDLDILVIKKDFNKVITLLIEQNYQSLSHDQALGGRIKGMQRNLVNDSRIKIDLHQDFTWKKSHYLDLNLVWNNLEQEKVAGIKCLMPKVIVDVFIIIINIIFEKTYINKSDYDYVKKYVQNVFNDITFDDQARKYGWILTYRLFKRWFKLTKKNKYPIFIPIYLVICSYFEKLIHDKKIDIISFMYYVFFRARYQINGVLPYE